MPRTRTSGFDSRFVLPRSLWSSTSASGLDSISGEVRTSSFTVFDCFGLRLRALARASGFPVRFGGCHPQLAEWRRHRGRAPALAAGA